MYNTYELGGLRMTNLPNFYKEVLTTWFSLKAEPKTIADMQREIIWNNKHITIARKTVFVKKLYDNGLTFINDVLEGDGKFISHEMLVQKYGNHITVFNYMCLKDAIPKKWRNTFKINQIFDLKHKDETVSLNYLIM